MRPPGTRPFGSEQPREGEAMSHRFAVLATVAAAGLVGAASASGAVIATASNGSPPGNTPQNHQNEPAVAIDANHPNIVVSGWNDFVDWAPCPQADATQFGTCADPADDGVGLSAVAFSFDSGHHWTPPPALGRALARRAGGGPGACPRRRPPRRSARFTPCRGTSRTRSCRRAIPP